MGMRTWRFADGGVAGVGKPDLEHTCRVGRVIERMEQVEEDSGGGECDGAAVFAWVHGRGNVGSKASPEAAEQEGGWFVFGGVALEGISVPVGGEGAVCVQGRRHGGAHLVMPQAHSEEEASTEVHNGTAKEGVSAKKLRRTRVSPSINGEGGKRGDAGSRE